MAALVVSCLACLTGGLPAAPRAYATVEDISRGAVTIVHQGDGVFAVSPPDATDDSLSGRSAARIDLRRIEHGYDPSIDADVPVHTDITLNDGVPALLDVSGREYALITLYQIDPPLADRPSRDIGIDRGIDMRSPADMVKSAYSNYVSPVFTDDKERLPIANHPIGHFLVKVEISGYPALLTGMTTIQRADRELVDWTLGRQLGIGGVLLTPQPGRLNSAVEAHDELRLRQRRIRVIDGLYFYKPDRKNVGPEYVVEDGNVVFARFKVSPGNAKDALATFVEFVWRGQHKIFGSLINRPYKGTGAGCTPFAVSWLKASGVIPFVVEPKAALAVEDMTSLTPGANDFWRELYRVARIPWDHIGCDARVGASRTVSAGYTVYDHLFYKEKRGHLLRAIPGLAEKIREDQGTVVSTLFAFGALTPFRDVVIASKRKDKDDQGDYGWARPGEGLDAHFWDNARFSRWIKRLWAEGQAPQGIKLVREGRFYGIEVDATEVPRQSEPYFAEADRLIRQSRRIANDAVERASCQSLFRLGLQ